MKIVGVMSGSSLDGLDIALCEFNLQRESLQWKIASAKTVSFSDEMREALKNANEGSIEQLFTLDQQLATFIANKVVKLCSDADFNPDYIASHGHTVLHQPSKGFSLQIGSGQTIAAISKIPTIANFRNKDISLGGQGAPLVPVGDKGLFKEYDACLNLGGIANITILNQDELLAWDICPFNQPLNFLANKLGKEFDESGKLAKYGEVNIDLLHSLQKLNYFKQSPPKSLANEWVKNEYISLLTDDSISVEDYLRTVLEHVVMEVSSLINEYQVKTILVTGGGAFNSFFIDCLEKSTLAHIVVPSDEIVNFKEALLFAYLGFLKVNNLENVYSSVTGSIKNSSSGDIYRI